MIKALLFDDEYIVLEALSVLVDWEGMGIELAGSASDGLSALNLFREIKPDIVLTDIRMPGMNGLQLIEEMLKEKPDICCIVFSGYNEFQYVKRAIQLGVADYVEKPITEQSIEQALRKVLRQISQVNETKNIERKWQDSKGELLVKATWDLLLFGKEAQSGWQHHFGLDADTLIGVTVISSSGACTFPVNPAYKIVYVRNGMENITVLFHLSKLSPSYWHEVASGFMNSGNAIGVGRTYSDVEDARLSYVEAQRALRSSLFWGDIGVVLFEEVGERISAPEEITDREEAIILSMQAGNQSLLMDEVDRFIGWIRAAKLHPDMAEREMLKLVYTALDIARDTGASGGILSTEQPYMPHVQMREMAAQGKLSEWFREAIGAIADCRMEVRKGAKHNAVEKARIYIERNVSRDVSLQEVAEHVGFNATYLSVLFKEGMGETYIKYLTRYRMELAKSMLRKGYKVNEVSEKVGYLTQRHFIDIFKKYTGQTPGQFKDT